MRKRVMLLGLILLNLLYFYVPVAQANELLVSDLLIVEVKLGGDSFTSGAKDPQEFIKIHNASSKSIDLSTISIDYAKESFLPGDCSLGEWGGASAKQYVLSGMIEPGAFMLLTNISLTDNKSGSVRIVQKVDSQVLVHDLVGWGEKAPCYDVKSASTIANSKSLKRQLDCNEMFVDTNNNFADFVTGQIPTPQSDVYPFATDCADIGQPECLSCDQPEVITIYPLHISELLPNPASYDSGNEFIELHNPNQISINLADYQLQVVETGKLFALPEVMLHPDEYLALSDKVTKLVLPNTSATLRLLHKHQNTVVDAIKTYSAPSENMAWALIDDDWAYTNQPTPNAPNKPSLVTDTELDEQVVVVANQLAPCPAGQERNPDTNRCRLIRAVATATSLVPCQPGQERNPQTNRCRSTAATVLASLVPCREGQERNPETNRCRAVASAPTAMQPCAEGQERNPDTNRCRKIVASSSSSNVIKDVETTSSGIGVRWWMVFGVLLFAMGYAVYEWRHDIRNIIIKRRIRKITRA